MASNTQPILEDDVDTFVPDARVREEFDITAMTLHRWDKRPPLGFPPPILINGRKYRSRRQLEDFKRLMLRQAMANRSKKTAE